VAAKLLLWGQLGLGSGGLLVFMVVCQGKDVQRSLCQIDVFQALRVCMEG
jgi:hypothetical protein